MVWRLLQTEKISAGRALKKTNRSPKQKEAQTIKRLQPTPRLELHSKPKAIGGGAAETQGVM
jgi:hypothetical protein